LSVRFALPAIETPTEALDLGRVVADYVKTIQVVLGCADAADRSGGT
jgi:hypothetical protein